MEDPIAAAQVPNDSTEVAQEKALQRRCWSEKAAAVSEGEQRVLFAALQDGVNQRRDGDPTQDVQRWLGEDQDLKHAGCGGQHPGIASDLEHDLSVAKASCADTKPPM